ncbi:MAG TPA: Smr/MutS family protein [Caulobacteraceae bacterium]|jgi:DNA-nicking Smr family endonuclease
MTRRPLRPDEVKVWAEVASTVEPAPGKTVPEVSPEPEALQSTPVKPSASAVLKRPARKAPAAPDLIEPKRQRRIVRERDPIDGRIDLHGMDQDRARLALHGFLQRAYDDGARAVLVITGKGTQGEGVIRRRTPDWLAEPAVRPMVAGVSQAHRRHGGEGALYVALKRKG